MKAWRDERASGDHGTDDPSGEPDAGGDGERQHASAPAPDRATLDDLRRRGIELDPQGRGAAGGRQEPPRHAHAPGGHEGHLELDRVAREQPPHVLANELPPGGGQREDADDLVVGVLAGGEGDERLDRVLIAQLPHRLQRLLPHDRVIVDA
jgi:hypothetical protein